MSIERGCRGCNKGFLKLLGQQYFVIIFNGIPVGRIGLHHINMMNKNAAIGYWISKDAEGKGIITQSCKVIIDYGFRELALNRIELKAATHNLRSRAIPEKFGFIQEGILRQAELVNNEYFDIVLYSLLRNEWKNQ